MDTKIDVFQVDRDTIILLRFEEMMSDITYTQLTRQLERIRSRLPNSPLHFIVIDGGPKIDLLEVR